MSNAVRSPCQSFPGGCQCSARTCLVCMSLVYAHEAVRSSDGWSHLTCGEDDNVTGAEVQFVEKFGREFWSYRLVRKDDSQYGPGILRGVFASADAAKVAVMECLLGVRWRLGRRSETFVLERPAKKTTR